MSGELERGVGEWRTRERGGEWRTIEGWGSG